MIALLAQLSVESTVLVGWSLGAQIACEIARKWPDKVNTLILVGASPVFFLSSDELTFPAFPKSAAEGLLNSLSTSFDKAYQGLVFGFFPEYTPRFLDTLKHNFKARRKLEEQQHMEYFH